MSAETTFLIGLTLYGLFCGGMGVLAGVFFMTQRQKDE